MTMIDIMNPFDLQVMSPTFNVELHNDTLYSIGTLRMIDVMT
jgi:hypothetical protein